MPSKSDQPPTLVYVSNTRFPTEKAHGIGLAKLCEAFAEEGVRVEVVVPRVRNAIVADPFSFYGVGKNFSVTYLPTVDLHLFGLLKKVFFVIQLFSFSIRAFFYCWRFAWQRAMFFSHDYVPLYFLSFLPNHIIYDIHHFPGKNFLYRRVMRHGRTFPVQTKWKVGELSRRFGIPAERIPYWPNGVDLAEFRVTESTEGARKKLGLPPGVPLALYLGQLFPWKGADTFVRSAKHVKSTVHYAIVGGEDRDRKRITRDIPEARNEKISFYPFQPRDTIPLWLRAADVLVLPNTGSMKVSTHYTSPMKLFEYMAAEKPIVASDIPSIREIVSEREVFFFVPDDPRSLAATLEQVLANPVEAAARAKRARAKAGEYTWRKRASVILGTLPKTL